MSKVCGRCNGKDRYLKEEIEKYKNDTYCTYCGREKIIEKRKSSIFCEECGQPLYEVRKICPRYNSFWGNFETHEKDVLAFVTDY